MRMELGLNQQQALRQIQTLSPQMYMSMEILCLNALDLEQRVGTELENNETLERVEPASEAPDAAPAAERTEASREEVAPEEAPAEESDSFEQRFERWDQYSREEYGATRSVSSYRGEKDEKHEALSNTEGRPESLQEHLEQQVHLLGDDEIQRAWLRCRSSAAFAGVGEDAAAGSIDDPSRAGEPGAGGGAPSLEEPDPYRHAEELDAEAVQRVRELCSEVIYNIDRRGYTLYNLEEIRDGLEDRPPPSLLRAALEVVRSLDPPGVGGRDLAECLLLQLQRDPQDYPLEERIIREHLSDLGHNRLPKIARSLGVTIEDVKEAVRNIASLDPLPGRLYGSEMPRYVKPDVVVDEVEGRYEIRVESDYIPRLQINSHYRNLYRQSRKDPEVKKYLKKKIDSAEWLISAIRQRQSTLQKIAQEVVDIQSEFLDHGITRLKPLKMADVADRVGVHVSTVSRAISGKYIQTPRGIFEIKYFFTGGATKSDGNVEARGSVVQRIKDLVAGEDKKNPLSDIRVVRELAKSGIHISRRTVTKYREAEGIPSSRERRSY